MKNLASLLFPIGVLGLLGGTIVTYAFEQPPLVADLAGEWQYALSPDSSLNPEALEWQSIQLPGDLPWAARREFQNWVAYRKSFVTPEKCLGAKCSLVFGEMGDGANVYLNGELIGSRGGFPEDPFYEHHYAVNMEIPATCLNTTESLLIIQIYSPKFELTGPRRPPVGVALSRDARSYERSKAFRTVFLNVSSAGGLAVLALFVLLGIASDPKSRSLRRKYVVWAGMAGLFLVSFSEIPREYLPLGFAIALHCVLRYAMDWAFFNLVSDLFSLGRKVMLAGNVMFVLVEALYTALALAQLICPNALQGTTIVSAVYVLIRVTAWLNGAGAVTALACCLMRRPWTQRWAAGTVAAATLLVLQLYDISLFFGFVHGDYTSKFYLPILGICGAAYLLNLSVESHINLVRQADHQSAVNQIARQMAHDIQSPLAAMSTVMSRAKALPEDQRIMMRSAVSRVHEIANDFQHRHRVGLGQGAAEKGGSIAEVELLAIHLESIVLEKRLERRAAPVTLECEITEDNFSLCSAIDAADFRRLLSNLLNNAYEAIEEGGAIEVVLRSDAGWVVTDIRDGGKGIPAELIDAVQERGVTCGKPGGSGLGLAHAKEAVQRWGGELRLSSQIGEGTTVSIRLPRTGVPAWFAESVPLTKGSVALVLDDDPSIHHAWRARFEDIADEARPQIAGAFSPAEFRRAANKHRPGLCLVDYELIGEVESGLDVLESMPAMPPSILVTSRNDEREVRERCLRLGISILPKALVAYVPLHASPEVPKRSPRRANAPFVLIDDDKGIRDAWTYVLGEKVSCYESPAEFFTKSDHVNLAAAVYIDQNLGNGILGSATVSQFLSHGYTKIYIATGDAPQWVPQEEGICGVVGKVPPRQN